MSHIKAHKYVHSMRKIAHDFKRIPNQFRKRNSASNDVVINVKRVKIRLFRVSIDNGNNVFITFVFPVFVSTEHVKRCECAHGWMNSKAPQPPPHRYRLKRFAFALVLAILYVVVCKNIHTADIGWQ